MAVSQTGLYDQPGQFCGLGHVFAGVVRDLAELRRKLPHPEVVMKDRTLAGILSRFPGRRILVIEDVMLDEYLWGSVHRISPEAPVPVVALQRRSYTPGGAANAAANVVGLRGQAILAGIVGGDERGRQLLATLAESEVCVEGIVVDGMRPTTTKTRILAQGQQVVGSVTSGSKSIGWPRAAIRNTGGMNTAGCEPRRG